MKLNNFHLEKMYFDCIDKEGNCFVVYWAKLRFGWLRLSYTGLVFSDSKNHWIEKSSFKAKRKPIQTSSLLFEDPSLEIKGTWEQAATPITLTLYVDEKGNEVQWNCHHPKTKTTLAYKDKLFQGLGYAETIRLPIKPWQLPIQELRWGRFLSNNFTIIWIQWKGEYPINKLICNGEIYGDASFEADGIHFNKGKCLLKFHESVVIREGRLSRILSTVPWLKLIFKSKILNTQEIKYKSKSSFIQNSEEVESGWSLYEIVRF